jgi:hypothetical protein
LCPLPSLAEIATSGQLRDGAFVTAKNALVAGISSGITAAAMYALRLL